MLTYLLSSDVIPNGVRSGSLIIIFVLSVFFDRSVWLGMDYLISFITGLALFLVPHHLLEFQILGNLETQHYMLARALGIIILSNVLYCYMVSNSRDGTVHISYLTSKSASLCLMLLAGAYAVYGHGSKANKPKLTDEQFLSFSGLACLLSLLGNIYHLAISKDYSTFPNFQIRFHMHLKLDFLLSITRAIAIYTFPLVATKALNAKQDIVSHTLLRFIASEDVLASLISLQAGAFLYERDKTMKMYCRIQNSATQLLFFTYIYYFKTSSLSATLCIFCGINILLIVNALFSLTESAMLVHDYRSPNKNGKDENIDHSWFEARKTPEKASKQLFT